MKQITATIVISLFLTSFVSAQLNSGSKFIAGTSRLAVNSYSDKDLGSDLDVDKYFNMGLNAKAGYFIKNRIAVGALADFGYSSLKYGSSDYKDINSSFLLGPVARYYLEYITLIPFAEASLGFGSSSSKILFDTTETTYKHSLLNASLGIGADYFLNENIAIEGLLNYSIKKQKPTGEGATGDGHVEKGLGASFGVVIYFGVF